MLVGFAGRRALPEVRASLDELARLADTAGALVVGELIQKRGAPHPATLFSKGKVDEIKGLVATTNADTVVCDEDLTPAQVRNLEKALDRKVVDRSEIILSIFAKHARTRESRLQVEVAQLEYSLPRLRHMWSHLERLGGGIGTRGPGESQLETDRRIARDRVALLKRELTVVEKERRVQRQSREGTYRVAVVGYTNAGKSTLFNALTKSDVRAEDRLFATLDATTRRLVNANREVLLLTDTVGFIRKLPHHLVASFRSTLAEVIEADLWLHVVDAADPQFRGHIRNVEEVLASIAGGARPKATNSRGAVRQAATEGAAAATAAAARVGELHDAPATPARPTLLVFNKVDAIADDPVLFALPIEYPGSLRVSAHTGEGLPALRERLWEERRESRRMAAEKAARARASALPLPGAR